MIYSQSQINTSIFAFAILVLLATCPIISYGQKGLLAEYYDGPNFERFVSKTYVNNIEDYWDEYPPVEGIDPHSCSIRWTGKLKPAETQNYIFSAVVDDGIGVWIDGELIIDRWHLNDLGIFEGTKRLVANQEYDFRVEYFNALLEAEIKLLWAIEKPKEDQTWAEYFFGVDYPYEVIGSDFFLIPEVPQLVEVPELEPEPVVVSKPKKKEPVSLPKPKKEKKVVPAPTPITEVKKEVMTIEKAEKYIPKNVQFVISKAEVLESSFEELNTFAKFMMDNPTITVTIEGHTDVVGDKEKNQALSETRADKIKNYLIRKGTEGKRIETIGYGGSQPLKVPKEGAYYPLNRRVVFKLSGLDN